MEKGCELAANGGAPGPCLASETCALPPCVPIVRRAEAEDRLRPNDYRLLDERRTRLPRARQLLVVELQNLERLWRATPGPNPDRAALLARIGLTYAELAWAAESEGLAPHPSRVRQDMELEKAARIQRLAYERSAWFLTRLIEQHPSFCAGDVCRDAFLHHRALAELHLGKTDAAKQAWLELLQTSNEAPSVAAAHVGLAELATREPTLSREAIARATEHYEAAALAEPHRLTAYACYQLARLQAAAGQHAMASLSLQRALDHLALHPQAAAALAIGRDAQRALDHGFTP